MRMKYESIVLAFFATAVMGSGVGYSKIWLYHIFLLFVFLILLTKPEIRLFTKVRTKYAILFAALFSVYSLSVLWSISPADSLQYLVIIAIGSSLTILIVCYCTTEDRLTKTVRVIIFSFFIAILIGCLEAFTAFRLPTSPLSDYAALFGRKSSTLDEFNLQTLNGILAQPTSFWGNPNNFSIALAISAPFFVSSHRFIYAYICSPLIFLLISMAGSRGALLALIISLGLYLLLTHIKIFVLFLFVIPVFIFSIPYLLDFARNSEVDFLVQIGNLGDLLYLYLFEFESGQNSIGIRQELIRNGLDALWQSGGIGVGAGGSEVVQERLGGVGNAVTSMHNFWVEVFVDVGFVGISIFLVIVFLIVIDLFRLSMFDNRIFFRRNARIFLAAFFAFCIGSVSASSVIYFLPMWIIFGLVISLIHVSGKNAAMSYPISSGAV